MKSRLVLTAIVTMIVTAACAPPEPSAKSTTASGKASTTTTVKATTTTKASACSVYPDNKVQAIVAGTNEQYGVWTPVSAFAVPYSGETRADGWPKKIVAVNIRLGDGSTDTIVLATNDDLSDYILALNAEAQTWTIFGVDINRDSPMGHERSALRRSKDAEKVEKCAKKG